MIANWGTTQWPGSGKGKKSKNSRDLPNRRGKRVVSPSRGKLSAGKKKNHGQLEPKAIQEAIKGRKSQLQKEGHMEKKQNVVGVGWPWEKVVKKKKKRKKKRKQPLKKILMVRPGARRAYQKKRCWEGSPRRKPERKRLFKMGGSSPKQTTQDGKN